MFIRFFQTLRIGVYSLLLHKLRSFLAVLGILIGIMSVIWLVAMGEGVSYQAQQQIKELGANNIIIRNVKPAQEGSEASRSFFLQYGILEGDYKRITSKANVPTIDKAVPMREIQKEVRNFSHIMVDSKVVGCTPEHLELNHLTMASGRFLSDKDRHEYQNVAVLAAETAEVLFPLENPLGRAIQIDTDFYEIVGVTESRDPSAAIGGSLESRDYNKDVYIPLSTLRARIGDMVFTSKSGSREGEVVELSQITVRVKNFDDVYETAEIIETLLDKYHEKKDVAVVVPKELLRQAELLRMMFNILLVLIAGISLVVGGIGIMNIMLATVTERTREIGIRRALGAKRRDIIQQFLAESVVLTGVGGVVGVGLGYLVGPVVSLVRNLAQKWAPDTMHAIPPEIMNLEPQIAMWSIWVSLGISFFVGVVFGLYPAYRAAQMDPIEALRHE